MRCELLRGALGLSAFTPAAAAWLAQDPMRHNHLGTLIGPRADGTTPTESDAVWALLRADPPAGSLRSGPLVGVAAWTPPRLLLVPELDPTAAEALVDALLAAGDAPPGVTGMAPGPTLVATAWAERTGGRTEPGLATRLLVLGRLQSPDGVAGRLIRADWSYRSWLAKAVAAFDQEVPTESAAAATEQDAARTADQLLGAGAVWLWEVRGEPVAIAASRPAVHGVYRISMVYTPPERRRRGYAAAAVAELSQHLRDIGAREVILFTDAANPTSNGVYERIGYRRLADGETWIFTPS